ncbi:MAG: hypothetical protein IKK50_00590 [Ruminiclostridium sp.]|nr:hypothetical protein [Ruminiclostridium sp.]
MKPTKFSGIEATIVIAVVIAHTWIFALIMVYAGPGPGFRFQPILNSSGEPLPAIVSIILYFAGCYIGYGLVFAAVCVVVVEPISFVYMIVKKIPVTRKTVFPGLTHGFTASFFASALFGTTTTFLQMFGLISLM